MAFPCAAGHGAKKSPQPPKKKVPRKNQDTVLVPEKKILVPGLLVTYFFSRVEGSALDRTTKAKPWSDIPIKKLFGLDAEFQIENY